ncbi:hypothetical protein J6590_005393 [Homalodisca vitripennis]|nr:hypothetical protein J6590_005393 [Homalodisca vitripennis]
MSSYAPALVTKHIKSHTDPQLSLILPDTKTLKEDKPLLSYYNEFSVYPARSDRLPNILDKFNPGARQMINAGKAYLKALHGAAAASRLYVEAITKLARQSQQGTWGGSADIGAALMKMVEVYKEIQAQQMNILKAFYVDLLVPLETNLEKDTKVVQLHKFQKVDKIKRHGILILTVGQLRNNSQVPRVEAPHMSINFTKFDSGRVEGTKVMLDSLDKKEKEQNRASFKPIIDSTIFCGENEIPLRGHWTIDGRKPFRKEGRFSSVARVQIKLTVGKCTGKTLLIRSSATLDFTDWGSLLISLTPTSDGKRLNAAVTEDTSCPVLIDVPTPDELALKSAVQGDIEDVETGQS